MARQLEVYEQIFYESELKGVDIMLEALDEESVLYRACESYKKELERKLKEV